MALNWHSENVDIHITLTVSLWDKVSYIYTRYNYTCMYASLMAAAITQKDKQFVLSSSLSWLPTFTQGVWRIC